MNIYKRHNGTIWQSQKREKKKKKKKKTVHLAVTRIGITLKKKIYLKCIQNAFKYILIYVIRVLYSPQQYELIK